ncbi:UV-B-induced protein At3g17800, chloroplastic-like [Wolffia australiana]
MDRLVSPITSSSCSSSISPGVFGSLRSAAKSGFPASVRPHIFCVGSRTWFSGRFIKRYRSISAPKESRKHIRGRSRVRASSSESQIPPLQLESPTGQFLSEILVSYPHLLYAAVDEQLEQLQTELNADKQKQPTNPATDIVLYKRISEVRAKERGRALEEILYTLVVQKFMDAEISLIPCLSLTADVAGHVDQWPAQDEELERIHSPEALEMIQNHLALILGNRVADRDSVADMSKLRVGQVYAASIMYGYFLKRVDQRFQLDKTTQSLPSAVEEVGPTPLEVNAGGFGFGIRPTMLRAYVMGLDPETLQRCATVRSKEALGLVERQTAALFGKSTAAISSREEMIMVSFAGLRRLILEAVAFGAFLWDVEAYVDSRFRLAPNF